MGFESQDYSICGYMIGTDTTINGVGLPSKVMTRQFIVQFQEIETKFFYKFEGLVPKLVSTFFIRKFKGMKGDVKDVKSLAFNARYFDRFFLNSLEWERLGSDY